jgi:nickel-dependent lactate racemase
LVKSLSPAGTITSRVQRGAGRLVRLEHKLDGQAPPALAVDPRAATKHALAKPLDFPPLAAALVPGDRVAIAVDEAVPCVAGVVRGAIDALADAGVSLDAISVVLGDTRVRDLCRAELDDNVTKAVHFVVHDPDDPHDLCFVGLINKQQPLRINRTIFDADLVLPIGCARLPGIRGSCGAYDSLYPRFSDAEAIDRFRAPGARATAELRKAARRETNEAGWQLGVAMAVRVVPGAAGSVAEVVAGEPRAAARHAQLLCERQWSFRATERASLVVAAVGGGPAEQTWDNVARALALAERLVADDGAVAICSALDRPPGKSLSRLIGSQDFAAVERKARNDHTADSWPAWQLARALQRGPVYFLSRLDGDTVEDMGLAPVADVEELVRLAGRHESCIVLDDSQHTLVTVNGED